MPRSYVLIALFATMHAGCSSIFGLDEVALPADAASDAPPDAALDTDGDGVADMDDNCPAAANADQADADKDAAGDACDSCPQLADDGHDEDRDGVADRCDSCPIDQNPDQANGDGDGLGDRCDGNPSTFDCIIRFDGFGSLHDWTPIRGTWIVEDDALVQTNPEVTQGLIVTDATYTNPRVQAHGTVVAFGSPASHNVGVWGAATLTANVLPDGIVAEVFDSSAVNTQLAVTSVTNGATTALQTYAALAPAIQMRAGSVFDAVMELRLAPSWSARGAVDASMLTQGATNATAGTRKAGLRAHGTIARFDWVWIVVRPPTMTCPLREP